MRLIDADALLNKDREHRYYDREGYEVLCKYEIEDAPTIEAQTIFNLIARSVSKDNMLLGVCPGCEYKKFTDNLISGIVEVMKANEISSVDQLINELNKYKPRSKADEQNK